MIWCFLSNGHIVNVRFTETRRSDADEPRIGLQFFNVSTAGVAKPACKPPTSQLSNEITSKAVAADHSRLNKLSTENEETQQKIAELSAEWEHLSLMLEGENS